MKYKLIVSDMDGTLLGSNHEISQGNKIAIKKAIDKGIKVIPASGRIYDAARKHFNFLDKNIPLIACNGAIIKETKTDKVIYKNSIEYEACLKVIDIFEKHDIYYQLYSEDTLFCKNSSLRDKERTKKRLKNFFTENIKLCFEDNLKDHIAGNDILKIIAIEAEDREKIKKVKEEVSKINGIEVTSSWKNNIEVMNKGVSKGEALKNLLEYLDMDREHVIAFGDNYNDLPMIEYAEIGIAMENADDEIKKKADYITEKNDDDGVAKAIYKFLNIDDKK